MELNDITPSNVLAFIKDMWQSVFGVTIRKKNLIAYSEMVVYRTTRCAECVADGACLKEKGGCSCKMPAMAFNPRKSCGRADKKFEEFKGGDFNEWWTNQKKDGNFDVFVKHF